ncbi:MAG: response regulator [Deltaproteobacteria bacterium]|jgi:CheY-like chemotaxis protein|nr:response regulator [Deltaproteobacteria bacterium]MDA8305281.1 response regulator [Deltaproteobacteria bacterium]
MMEKHETVVRVLVADDDEVFLEILAETVEQADAVVELASDGLAALEQLSAGDFDILISDLNMPRMDGLTLFRQVRTFYPHILCILITGFGSLESAIQALRLGAYDYIQKPFMMEQVGVTIRNAVDRVKAYKERAGLLLEIENLQRKICSLEGRQYNGGGDYNNPGISMGGSFQADLSRFRPDAFLEKPQGNPNRAIAALEALKGLKRDGIITDSELHRLKKLIVSRIESGRL